MSGKVIFSMTVGQVRLLSRIEQRKVACSSVELGRQLGALGGRGLAAPDATDPALWHLTDAGAAALRLARCLGIPEEAPGS